MALQLNSKGGPYVHNRLVNIHIHPSSRKQDLLKYSSVTVRAYIFGVSLKTTNRCTSVFFYCYLDFAFSGNIIVFKVNFSKKINRFLLIGKPYFWPDVLSLRYRRRLDKYIWPLECGKPLISVDKGDYTRAPSKGGNPDTFFAAI